MRSAVDFGGFLDWRYALAGFGAFLCVTSEIFAYALGLISAFRVYYALFIPYFYIQVFAEFKGVPINISQYLLAIINATGVPARILPGFVADRFGV